MRVELLRQNPWVDPHSVSLTGCAHFQCVGRQDLLIPETKFRAALGQTPNRGSSFSRLCSWMVPEEERYIRLLKDAVRSLSATSRIVVPQPHGWRRAVSEVLRADEPEIVVSKPDWRWDRKRNWCFQRRADQIALQQSSTLCIRLRRNAVNRNCRVRCG
jgi:hypothetical protein